MLVTLVCECSIAVVEQEKQARVWRALQRDMRATL